MEDQAQGLSNEAMESITREIRRALREELTEIGFAGNQEIELAARWDGGEVVLRPGTRGLQEKTIPMETFFHKIVMARERLRVLEQKINNHPKLDDAERIELQGYITRVYGSFTTFNVLFDNRADWFVGSGSDR